MPRCGICGKSVPGPELRPAADQMQDDGPVLACSDCRELKVVPTVQDQEEVVVSEKRKNHDNKRDKIASLDVYDISDDDYRLDLNVKIGGVRIEVSKKVSEIRDFFTKRKDKRARRGLKAVPKDR